MCVRRKRCAGAVGKPALFPHFFIHPGGEGAATQNVVHHKGGLIVGIVTCQSGKTEQDRGLRYRQLLVYSGSELRFEIGNLHQLSFLLQRSKDLIENSGEGFSIDRTDDTDDQPLAGEKLALLVCKVVRVQAGQCFGGAKRWPGVGVITEHCFGKGSSGNRIRIAFVASRPLRQLGLHPLHRGFVEARLVHGEGQKVTGLVKGWRQGPQAAVEPVLAGAEVDADGKFFQLGLEGLGIHFTRAFVQRCGEQARQAFLSDRVLHGATVEGKIERNDRHGMVFYQPGCDAFGAGDFLDLDGLRQPHQAKQGDKRQSEGGDRTAQGEEGVCHDQDLSFVWGASDWAASGTTGGSMRNSPTTGRPAR